MILIFPISRFTIFEYRKCVFASLTLMLTQTPTRSKLYADSLKGPIVVEILKMDEKSLKIIKIYEQVISNQKKVSEYIRP